LQILAGILFAQTEQTVMEAFADLKEKLNVSFLMEIIILAAWSIWIVRNNKISRTQILQLQVGRQYSNMS
jgi:hypothetical protein